MRTCMPNRNQKTTSLHLFKRLVISAFFPYCCLTHFKAIKTSFIWNLWDGTLPLIPLDTVQDRSGKSVIRKNQTDSQDMMGQGQDQDKHITIRTRPGTSLTPNQNFYRKQCIIYYSEIVQEVYWFHIILWGNVILSFLLGKVYSNAILILKSSCLNETKNIMLIFNMNTVISLHKLMINKKEINNNKLICNAQTWTKGDFFIYFFSSTCVHSHTSGIK